MFFNETYSDFVEVLRAWTNIIGIYLFEFNSENFPLAKYIRETRIVAGASRVLFQWSQLDFACGRIAEVPECRASLSMKGQ